MSFLVAVMPAPSLSLIMPFSSSSSRARASLVVSLGTAILMTAASFLPQPVRARVRTRARIRAANLFVFFIMILSFAISCIFYSLCVVSRVGKCKCSFCVQRTHSPAGVKQIKYFFHGIVLLWLKIKTAESQPASRCKKLTCGLYSAEGAWESRWLFWAQENMHMHMGMHIIIMLRPNCFMLLSPFRCFGLWA